MPNTPHSATDSSEARVYQIRIKGHLDHKWADWFGGLSITLQTNGDTLLTGPVVDQAALYGMLKKVRDLSMSLLSLTHVKTGHTDVPDSKGKKK